MRYLLIISLFLSGCGYVLHQVPDYNEVPTISIPYVEGDIDGKLTAALTHEIALSGAYVVRTSGGEWILEAKVIDDTYENIGFRYDRSRNCHLKHYVIPVELREGILLEVRLIHAASQVQERGPCRLYAQIEYDHDYYTIRDGVNVFSLGQLTDIDSAEDAARTPLYQKIAEKVASWLSI